MAKYIKKKIEELDRLGKEEALHAPKAPITLVLDDIRSMQNVGAIFRSADAFGIQHIILLGITPKPPHREIHKSALGAEDAVSWDHAADWGDAKRLLPAEYLLAPQEQTHHSLALHSYLPSAVHHVLVLGNEVHGVSDTILADADMVLEIEQSGHKHSLNVATSAGILLYHMTRVHSIDV